MSIRVVHGIVCSRIILNLRQAASPGNASPTLSTGLIFAQLANQADTVPLETGGTRDDNEDLKRNRNIEEDHLAVERGVAL